MKLYLLFFLFSFVSTQSYEKIIKVAVGPTTIKCNNNDVFVTNDTKYWKCNQQESCLIRDHKVLYVCVKVKFAKANCLELTNGATIFQDGCFFGNFSNKVEVHIINKYTKFVHFVVLEMSFAYKDTLSEEKHCLAFCYQRLDQEFWMSVNAKGWILVKVSNNSKEDFREFFSDDLPSTPLPSREESDDTIIIEDSSFATKESEDTTTIEDSSTATKESNDTATIEYTSSATKEPNDPGPIEDSPSVTKVILIPVAVVAALVVILLIIFLVVAYFFYRKNLPKTKTTEHSKEIPPSENETFNQILSGRESDNPLYMSMYGINQLDERSQLKTPRSPSQTNKPAQNCEDAFYANVTKQKDGVVTDRKNLPKTKTTEHSKEIPPSENETFNQIPSGRELDILVDNILYEIPQSDERSQPETPISPNQKNKPAQNCEDAFYANVTKQEDGGPVIAGDSSHIVVNGDLYATVNKDESYSDNSARLEDNLVREEVNGEMYTVVQKPYLAI